MNLLAVSFAATQDCFVAARRISTFLQKEESHRRTECSEGLGKELAACAAFAEK